MPDQNITPHATPTPVQFGTLLRATRNAQGLTLEQLSGLSGFGMRFLSELERGKPTAELGKALQVAELLGLYCYLIPRSSRQPASTVFSADDAG